MSSYERAGGRRQAVRARAAGGRAPDGRPHPRLGARRVRRHARRARRRCRYEKIPGFAASTIVGHAGNVVYGSDGGVAAAGDAGARPLLRGPRPGARRRFPRACWSPLGCKTLVITNAAGGVDATLQAGEIVILSRSPQPARRLAAARAQRRRARPALPRHDRGLRPQGCARWRAAPAGDVGLTLREGVYAALARAAVRDAGGGAHAARRSAPTSSACRRCPR